MLKRIIFPLKQLDAPQIWDEIKMKKKCGFLTHNTQKKVNV